MGCRTARARASQRGVRGRAAARREGVPHPVGTTGSRGSAAPYLAVPSRGRGLGPGPPVPGRTSLAGSRNALHPVAASAALLGGRGLASLLGALAAMILAGFVAWGVAAREPDARASATRRVAPTGSRFSEWRGSPPECTLRSCRRRVGTPPTGPGGAGRVAGPDRRPRIPAAGHRRAGRRRGRAAPDEALPPASPSPPAARRAATGAAGACVTAFGNDATVPPA